MQPVVCLVFLALGGASLAGAGTAVRDPHDFPLPPGLARTSFSENPGERRRQEVANYHAEAGLDQVLGDFRRILGAAGWSESPASDSGTGVNRVVITDWQTASREAEIRFYSSRKGGTDVWLRVNTYPTAGSSPAAADAARPPPAAAPTTPKPSGTAAAAGVAPAPTTNSAVLVVPDVTGKELKDAEWYLRGSGFAVQWTAPQQEMLGPGIRPDVVARQDPAAGKIAGRGSTIALTAKEFVTRVPNIGGIAVQRAEELLRDRHLVVELGNAMITSDRAQAGTVMSSKPVAGTVVRARSTVVLTPWKKGTPVPDVVGKSLQEATHLLQGPNGGPHFSVERLPPVAIKGPGPQPGRVKTQDPAAGALAPDGAAIRLTLWGEDVPVPDLVGHRLMLGPNSTTLLAGGGVRFEIQYGPAKPAVDPHNVRMVAEQSPAAHQTALNGSTIIVSLWAASGPVPNVVGQHYADAVQSLRSGRAAAVSFIAQAGPNQETRDRSLAGKVAQQSPAAGTVATDESTVVLSKWVLLQRLQDWVGAASSQARRGLDLAGYRVKFGAARPCVDPALDETVAAQDPVGGTMLAQEEAVTLVLYRLKPE